MPVDEEGSFSTRVILSVMATHVQHSRNQPNTATMRCPGTNRARRYHHHHLAAVPSLPPLHSVSSFSFAPATHHRTIHGEPRWSRSTVCRSRNRWWAASISSRYPLTLSTFSPSGTPHPDVPSRIRTRLARFSSQLRATACQQQQHQQQ